MSADEQPQDRTRTGPTPFAIGRDVHIDRGGGALLIAKRDMRVTRGGGQWLVGLRQQTIEQGGGGVLLSREAHVTNGFVGVVVAGRVTLEGTARALATISLPVAAAAAAGFALGMLFGKRRAA